MDGKKKKVIEKFHNKIIDKIIDESIDETIDETDGEDEVKKRDDKEVDDKDKMIRKLQKLWEPGILDNYNDWFLFTCVIQNEFNDNTGLKLWDDIFYYMMVMINHSWGRLLNKKKICDKKAGMGILHKWAKEYSLDEWTESFKVKKSLSYKDVCEEFEKKHAKIIEQAIYIKENEDGIIVMSEKKLVSAYKHMIYMELKIDNKGTPVLVKGNFI
jgi:hypothetical protein